jgi:hypothetical protein
MLNDPTNTNQLTRPTQNVRLPAGEGRKVGAATAASTFSDATRRCQNKIDLKNRIPTYSRKVDKKFNSDIAGMEQMNFEILGFKNQMTCFIFCLRPVYLVRTIKEA